MESHVDTVIRKIKVQNCFITRKMSPALPLYSHAGPTLTLFNLASIGRKVIHPGLERVVAKSK